MVRGLPGRRGDAVAAGRQIELELVHQKLLFGVQFSVAAQVYGRSGNDVEHLDGGEFVKHSPRGGSGRQWFDLGGQRSVKAIGQEVKQRVDESPGGVRRPS
jgi:hypothetical protein